MALADLLKDMGELEAQLRSFEERFGVKSRDFYEAMERGELEDFDALDEYRMQFIEWHALYKTWLSLDEKYRQLIGRQSVAIQIKSTVAA